MDSHFKNYEHIVALAYRARDGSETWLPIFNKDGRFGWYNSGRVFVNWSWRIVGPEIENGPLEDGIRNYTAFWLKQNDIPRDSAEFTVYAKRIVPPRLFATPLPDEIWESGYYRREISKPWVEVGSASWIDGEFEAHIENIEELQ